MTGPAGGGRPWSRRRGRALVLPLLLGALAVVAAGCGMFDTSQEGSVDHAPRLAPSSLTTTTTRPPRSASGPSTSEPLVTEPTGPGGATPESAPPPTVSPDVVRAARQTLQACHSVVKLQSLVNQLDGTNDLGTVHQVARSISTTAEDASPLMPTTVSKPFGDITSRIEALIPDALDTSSLSEWTQLKQRAEFATLFQGPEIDQIVFWALHACADR